MSRSYLDSGVLIAFFDASDRNDHQAARTLLLDPSRTFVISPYVELEILPHLARENRADFEIARELLSEFETADDLHAAWKHAYDVLLAVNLGAIDALHIGAALSAGCDELVTTERRSARRSLHRAQDFVRVVHLRNAI